MIANLADALIVIGEQKTTIDDLKHQLKAAKRKDCYLVPYVLVSQEATWKDEALEKLRAAKKRIAELEEVINEWEVGKRYT